MRTAVAYRFWLAVVGVGLLLAPSSASAIDSGSTACSIELRAHVGQLTCTVAIRGGRLGLNGSPVLTVAVGPGEAAHFAWDGSGRLVRADVGGRATAYVYDDAGRLDVLVDGAGEPTRYAYDARGRLVAAGAARFVYSDDGLARVAEPDGNVVDYSYDSAGRLVVIAEGGTERGIAYDERGRLVSARTTGATTSYEYDEIRLVRRVEDGVVTTYDYDERGDLTRTSDTRNEVVTYGYERDRSLRAVSSADGVTRYTYDGSGRVSGIAGPGGGSIELRYDDANRLAALTAETGDEVVVAFEHGDVNEPVIVGSLYTDGDGRSYTVTRRGRLLTCTTCP